MQDNNVHQGHRERLKNRFLNENLDGFEQHNMLELLLYYCIPRIDTNNIAHNLINRFGSISKVFDAPIEELIKVKGINLNSATLIKLTVSLSRVYMCDRANNDAVFDSAQKMGEYFINKYVGMTNEIVYLLLLDNAGCEIALEKLTEGDVSCAEFNVRKIVEFAIKHNAVSVCLAHNHPRGLPCASNNDIVASIKLKGVLSSIGITFVDHIIVAGNDFISIAEQGYLQ
ncbi:MAG: JAB domain-containing protein [Oscillospiraceae bacterium]